MNELLNLISDLKTGETGAVVNKRISEFDDIRAGDSATLFKELCFCLLTANYSASKAISIQSEVGDGFLDLPEADLAAKLKSLGYRYPNVRAGFIVRAREFKDRLGHILRPKTDFEAREWLVRNIKGLGFKESSHFLRNTGRRNLAIIDFHIVDILVAHGIIKRPKTLTPKVYCDIENGLKKIADELNLNLSELDLYLWYLETGEVLK